MNYTELVSAIQSYTENTFPTASINTLIEQAEQRIYNNVQFPTIRKNVLSNLNVGGIYITPPTGFLSVYSFAIIDPATSEYTYLLNKDVNFIREAYPNPNDLGTPKYYALFGMDSNVTTSITLMIGPASDTACDVEIHYNSYPESITTADTTWLGNNFDSVLLYGSLVEAYTYMKGEPDMVALYDSKYKEALALAKRLGDGMERQDAYRSGQFRQAVT